jgi:hypothetical protein
MTLRGERSGCRFAIAKTDEGKPVIKLELLHDSVSHLKSLTVGFEVLGGVTPEQARTLVDSMNERIVGVIVTASDNIRCLSHRACRLEVGTVRLKCGGQIAGHTTEDRDSGLSREPWTAG